MQSIRSIVRKGIFNMLVIQCDKVLTEEKFVKLHKQLTEMAEKGVVLLPKFCWLTGMNDDDQIDLKEK